MGRSGVTVAALQAATAFSVAKLHLFTTALSLSLAFCYSIWKKLSYFEARHSASRRPAGAALHIAIFRLLKQYTFETV